jgi:hypothetical protein
MIFRTFLITLPLSPHPSRKCHLRAVVVVRSVAALRLARLPAVAVHVCQMRRVPDHAFDPAEKKSGLPLQSSKTLAMRTTTNGSTNSELYIFLKLFLF